tara:strand:+ start:447 stop:677 length:231 start_codon:yes stop_codon:yes gene_type:complete
MRIKKSDLKRIIIEEMKKATDLAIDKDKPEDVKAKEDAWSGGENLHYNKDHEEDLIETFTAEKLRNFVLSELKNLD